MIFCVEDDSAIREMVLYALQTVGFSGEGFSSGDELFARLEEEIPDLIILDIMLPGKNGLEILEELREARRTAQVPVILLTAKSTDMDKISGLNKGADDYITKPFNILELLARIKAVMRRVVPEKKEVCVLSDIRLDPESRTVTVGDEKVEVTFKEFELLHYLMRNAEIVLSREQIMEEIWGFDFEGESRTVDVHIASLRSKLKDSGKYIRTVRNVGYKVSREP